MQKALILKPQKEKTDKTKTKKNVGLIMVMLYEEKNKGRGGRKGSTMVFNLLKVQPRFLYLDPPDKCVASTYSTSSSSASCF